MGIGFNDARLMFNARLAGASFDQVCTVGRQILRLHPEELAFFRNACAKPNSDTMLFSDYDFETSYAEGFFYDCLDAKSVSAIDYSDYEGANIVHDLNLPITSELNNRFDVVVDGGTLEHIFNFPVAIANLMKMVRVGGRLFMTSPANNLCGHGMYQFSPELMFRVFSNENGFEIVHVQLLEARFPSVELTRSRRLYEVSDPEKVRSRVSFVSKHPVMMMVEAKKIGSLPLFIKPPLQSDYVTKWKDNAAMDVRPSRAVQLKNALKPIFHLLPPALRRRINGYRQLMDYSLKNKRHFHRL